ncbi:MAG TPA: protein translocase subunit SecD [Verrucomicrobiae bacterium]|nr:protein translocase subunit SecD [Verrucomicrobiae bacterium]
MKSNDRWKFILVIAIVAWALSQIYPPTSRDLIQQFQARADNTDTNFDAIAQRAVMLQKTTTNTEFNILEEAIGTNSIVPYFTFVDARSDIHPTQKILNQLQRDASGKIKLGLDLQGGMSFLVEMDTNYLAEAADSTNGPQRAPDISGALSQAVEVLRKRVDAFGVAEPVIQPAGNNRILIQLPGLTEAERQSALSQITNAAYLEFRLVHENSSEILRNNEPIPLGYEVLKEPGEDPTKPPMEYVVKKKPELAGDFVTKAFVTRGNLGEPQITFSMTQEGGKKFGEITTQNVGRALAIVLDGELQTAPRIDEPILNGSCLIHGDYNEKQAFAIANVLQNPLRAPLHLVSSSDVDPTLGRDSIRSGIYASVASVIFVSLFMLIYYRLSGLTANVALITNIIILLGVMCSVGTTLTLPGIAGIVLTIGMAVDANVLIYERLREELGKGKSLRGAIDAGYKRAFGTIFDSHVTTLISSIILIFMGTGEIKGFGVTLTIGVAASLFTALVVTRLIFNFLLNRNWLKSLSMLHIVKSANVNFLKFAAPLAIATCLFFIGALVFGFTRGDKLFGVDFRGGDSVTFNFAQKIDQGKVSSALTAVGERDATVQYQKDMVGGGAETLRVTAGSGSAGKVVETLQKDFPDAKFQKIGQQEVGAIVGKEIQRSAVAASLMAMLGILIYVAFRYEFWFAVAAVAAVVHDVLFAIGAYCIANDISGRQFNATVVAAVLTIIGFSLNDKIVVFDRIREDLKLGVRGTFQDVINAALNQTLSRTIITSGTVFIATLCLYLWGGGVINDFAFTFLVGIIVGTYSSIYIASYLVLLFYKGQRPNIGASQVTMQGAQAKV